MANVLPDTYTDPIPIAVIGGTGLATLPSPPFYPVAIFPPLSTPWGLPSSSILILAYTHPGTTSPPLITRIAFLSRHGPHHAIAPHEIPNRANIAALRKLGVRSIVAFSAVGSLREEIRPRDFVIVDQLVDRTKGVRPWTFFEGGMVGHVGFAEPFDRGLRAVIGSALEEGVLEGGSRVHEKGTVVTIEGPQFSTRAESNLYRAWGCDVVNMSAIPESKLALEAEIAYAMICMSTDYDCWHSTNESVSVEMVMGHMAANAGNAKRVIAAVLEELSKEEHKDVVAAKHLKGQTRGAASITKGEGKSKEALEKMRWLFPGYFD